MKTATADYITEEQRQYGARPRVKAVIQGGGLAVPVEIDEDDIIDCGNLIASRPAYFHDIHGETHILTLDNRGHQWQPGHANFLIPDGIWYGREIHIYTGFDLAGGRHGMDPAVCGADQGFPGYQRFLHRQTPGQDIFQPADS